LSFYIVLTQKKPSAFVVSGAAMVAFLWLICQKHLSRRTHFKKINKPIILLNYLIFIVFIRLQTLTSIYKRK
jgi:hypothetical protein